LPQDTFHWLKIYLHCDCGWGSAPDPTGGALQHNLHTLVVFKGSVSQQRRNGRVDRARGKGRGGEKNGETGEGRRDEEGRRQTLPPLAQESCNPCSLKAVVHQ